MSFLLAEGLLSRRRRERERGDAPPGADAASRASDDSRSIATERERDDYESEVRCIAQRCEIRGGLKKVPKGVFFVGGGLKNRRESSIMRLINQNLRKK